MPDVHIRPPRGWTDLSLREIWQFRELVYFLAKRDLQIRYKQSFLGVSWAVLQPLVLAFVFALFFGQLVHIDSQGVPYPVFAIVGLVPWLFTAQAITQTSGSLVADANLLSKVYFPRLVIPIAKAMSLMLDLAISIGVLLVVMFVYGVSVYHLAELLPVFLALGVLTAFGIGTFFAAVNVKYRDVALIVPMIVQVGLFVTPVIYPGSLVTGPLQYVYALNPMTSVITGARWCLLGTPAPDPATVAASVGVAFAIFASALIYFRRNEQFFADVV